MKEGEIEDLIASAVPPPPVPGTPNPVVREMIGQVQSTTVYSYTGGLSGEWPVTIGGVPYTIVARYSHSGEPILKVMQYAYEHFQRLGLDVAFHEYT